MLTTNRSKKQAQFSFNKEYTLKNQRVKLTPLKESHIDLLYNISNDENIWKHFIENGYGRDNFQKYVHRALRNRSECIEYPFVIFDTRAKEYAGITRIYAVNNSLGNIKIGHTWIGKRFQGTGLNKNCKYVLFEFIFDQFNMNRIGFGVSSENIISIKAMASVGCTQEGVLRSFLPSENGTTRVDIILFSILKEEWDLRIKKKLKEKLKLYT